MTRLVRAHGENRLERTLQQLVCPALLILDEIGYLPLSPLKEQLFWLRAFSTVDELNHPLHEFKERYNRQWLIERHGYISPAAYREQLHAASDAA